MIGNSRLISIVIPVYNSERYLRECLDSLCGQSYRDIEIILVDDGSTDYSGEICKKYEEKDDRIVYIHKNNEGPGIARNVGLNRARGEYVMFVDSDDFFQDKRNIENIVRRIEKNKPDLIMYNVGTYWENAGELVREGSRISEDSVDQLKAEEKFLYILSKGMIYSGVLAKVIKRDVLINNGVWYEKGECEDIVWSLKVYKNSKNIDWCDDLVYIYRKGKSESRSTQPFTRDRLSVVRDICFDVKTQLQQYEEGIVAYIAYLYVVWLAQAYLSKDQEVNIDIEAMKECCFLLNYDTHPSVKLAKRVYKIVGYKFLMKLLGVYMKHLYKM